MAGDRVLRLKAADLKRLECDFESRWANAVGDRIAFFAAELDRPHQKSVGSSPTYQTTVRPRGSAVSAQAIGAKLAELGDAIAPSTYIPRPPKVVTRRSVAGC
ncbi:hypothetical protein MKUB_07960 [Mycobacterium kubicae]|uniref:DUF222 domain-containing protein n=1 Tax=Mycobacterium kubicae TaxID=120959 RepID=A0ABQ1BHZ5_9MYCO|nr:hypothetical protein MKUB_07960 [Mycobacterium kubicae]